MIGGELMENSENVFKPKESRWSQILKRLNLQSIGEFIRHGGEVEIQMLGFTEREERAFTELTKYLNQTVGEEKQENITEEIVRYCNVIEGIFFSLGMKVGAQLVIKLTDNLETDF